MDVDLTSYFDALAAIPNLRSAQFNDIEVGKTDTGYRFRGHAAVFDEIATLGELPGLGTATEEIKRGAFRKVLQRPDNIPLTLEHDQARVLATTKSGRLKLHEDAKGLAVEADLPDTSLARDLYSLVESDVVCGMSFGFVAGPRSTGNWLAEQRSSGVHRIISGFKRLIDVCATWNPTYPSATAQFRSLAVQYADDPELLQRILMGANPQLGDRAETTGVPDGEPDDDQEPDVTPGVAEHRSIAARKRSLNFLILTTGGIDDET